MQRMSGRHFRPWLKSADPFQNIPYRLLIFNFFFHVLPTSRVFIREVLFTLRISRIFKIFRFQQSKVKKKSRGNLMVVLSETEKGVARRT